MNLDKLIESNNPKAIELIQTIYSWMIAADMMENIAIKVNETEGYEPKFELKAKNNKFVKATKEFNSQLKKELGIDKTALHFGELADFMQELFEIAIFVSEEDRIKVLSTIKIMIQNRADH